MSGIVFETQCIMCMRAADDIRSQSGRRESLRQLFNRCRDRNVTSWAL